MSSPWRRPRAGPARPRCPARWPCGPQRRASAWPCSTSIRRRASRAGGRAAGKTKNPKLFEIDATTEAIELLISEGWEWVFVDTGPAKIELIEPGIAVADLVLIPTRPSAFDIEQAAICVELCESHGKPHAFVFNHAPAREADEVLDRLPAPERQHGDRDPDHLPAGLHGGGDGRQIRSRGREERVARKEIDALWAAVQKLLAEKVA